MKVTTTAQMGLLSLILRSSNLKLIRSNQQLSILFLLLINGLQVDSMDYTCIEGMSSIGGNKAFQYGEIKNISFFSLDELIKCFLPKVNIFATIVKAQKCQAMHLQYSKPISVTTLLLL